jgi:methionine synthase I (cobalamin-dependent)
MTELQRRLREKGHLLLDGGMGTLLMAAGLEPGAPPESWNLTHPGRIGDVHRGYLEAGSDVILTNSFGGNPFRLRGRGLEADLATLNEAAARIARDTADEAGGAALVAGSMGPSGEMMEPLGALTLEVARKGFAAQAAALAAGGVDLLWIETMGDLQEARAALEGAREASELPLVATLSFDAGGRTVMGVTPGQALEAFAGYDLAAVGANCGSGTAEIEDVIRQMKALDPPVPLVSKSNAGKPTWVGTELVYDGTPEVMRAHARRILGLGASLIGGCCGTTPAHIRAMAEGLEGATAASG